LRIKTDPKRSTFYNLCQKIRTGAGIEHTKQIERGRLTLFEAALPFRPKRI
jgi:hypothetical protein